MSIATRLGYSVAEYLEFDRNSPLRHEFFEGGIREMTGGAFRHILIILNLYRALYEQLPRTEFCVVTGEMRVKVNQNGLYTYPDLVVVKGQPEFEDQSETTLLNPIVLVEVLSDSTEKYDRNKKFLLYQGIPSFQEYILIAQDRPAVDHFVRDVTGDWQHRHYQDLSEAVTLQSVPGSTRLATIYQNIEFVPNS
jgi:Uma2 family endonuclease